MAEKRYLCPVTSRDAKYQEMTTEPVEKLVCKFAVPMPELTVTRRWPHSRSLEG